MNGNEYFTADKDLQLAYRSALKARACGTGHISNLMRPTSLEAEPGECRQCLTSDELLLPNGMCTQCTGAVTRGQRKRIAKLRAKKARGRNGS